MEHNEIPYSLLPPPLSNPAFARLWHNPPFSAAGQVVPLPST